MESSSPFFPGTQLQAVWDSMSIGWIKECPRLYYYIMIDRRFPRGLNLHLFFGLLYHASLEYYDKHIALGETHDEALEGAVLLALQRTWLDGKPWESGDSNKTRETLVRSIIWYLDQFGVNDNAKTIILSNGEPAVELATRMETDVKSITGQYFMLSCHLDRVVKFDNSHYVMDRKTTKQTLSPSYFRQYSPDNQMTMYSLVSDVVYHTPVKGVIIDAAQIAIGFTAFARDITTRTPGQLREWMHDFSLYMKDAERYIEQQYWPMNDKSCHKYGGCPFRSVCSKDPEVREQFLQTDFERTQWNPLADRE